MATHKIARDNVVNLSPLLPAPLSRLNIIKNENRYEAELNSFEKISDFLRNTYLEPAVRGELEKTGVVEAVEPQQQEVEIDWEKEERNARIVLVFIWVTVIAIICITIISVALSFFYYNKY